MPPLMDRPDDESSHSSDSDDIAMPPLLNREDDASSHFSDDYSSSDDSSYEEDMQSDHTPILNLTEILSSSYSSVEDDEQSNQSTPTTESMRQYIENFYQ